MLCEGSVQCEGVTLSGVQGTWRTCAGGLTCPSSSLRFEFLARAGVSVLGSYMSTSCEGVWHDHEAVVAPAASQPVMT